MWLTVSVNTQDSNRIMECLQCGYRMDAFETACPRCQRLAYKSAPVNAVDNNTVDTTVNRPANGIAPSIVVSTPVNQSAVGAPAPVSIPGAYVPSELESKRWSYLAKSMIAYALIGWLFAGPLSIPLTFLWGVVSQQAARGTAASVSSYLVDDFGYQGSVILLSLAITVVNASVTWLVSGQYEALNQARLQVETGSAPEPVPPWSPTRRKAIGIAVAASIVLVLLMVGLGQSSAAATMSGTHLGFSVVFALAGVLMGALMGRDAGELEFERAKKQSLLIDTSPQPQPVPRTAPAPVAIAASVVSSNPWNWIGVVSFLIPLLGLVLWFVFEHTGHYENSAAAGSGASLGFVFGISLLAPCIGLLIWVAYSRSDEDSKTNAAAIGPILGFITTTLYFFGKVAGA